ncbi:conserved hypothetical protein [Abyssogena phaseoliformis symbiont OG214]|uniref:M48 family metallopeptidase n=1 Tax=Abyssogena phaseoliformis symbiont TaxID=596095 RepID=UPI0019155BD9|nr:SprT family zinc-dependent metalloprotease [Abyssogena phaseoliformis symbiont]BBB22897.1 conserved hypothetical protein [Abyssogena phaseoliformis symbiont OG214]
MKPIIIRKDIKNINLRVKPNFDVVLSAPLKTTDEHIEHVLDKRNDWIESKLAFFRSKNIAVSQEYVSGEDCKFLGRHYRLKVTQSHKESVKLKGRYLNLFVKNKDNFIRKETLVRQWYYNKAEKYFQKVLIKYQPVVNKEIKRVRIRKMKTRWGSCNPSKSYINLNSELIKAPIQCVEYVIFHELTHLIYPNHDKNFYTYLTAHMPNWKQVKNRLENN